MEGFPDDAEGGDDADRTLRFRCEVFFTNDTQRNWKSRRNRASS
jgi:hypothetical protein